VEVNHPFVAPPHLRSLPYCNTIARLLCNIRPPRRPPRVYASHYTILMMAISCKGECAILRLQRPPRPLLVSCYSTSPPSMPSLPRYAILTTILRLQHLPRPLLVSSYSTPPPHAVSAAVPDYIYVYIYIYIYIYVYSGPRF